MAQAELSDTELDQALMLIREVPAFDGRPENLCSFVTQIECILELYPTQDERKTRILHFASGLRLSGEARRVNFMGDLKTWVELKAALIKEFNNYASYDELLRQLYVTSYNGSLRHFIEELEYKDFKIRSKLGLEDDASLTACYANALKLTIRNCISRMLPDGLFMTLGRHDISTIWNLKKAAQMQGIYDTKSRPAANFKDHNNKKNASSSDSDRNNCSKVNSFQSTQSLNRYSKSDASSKSPEAARLILRAHRYLK